MSELLLSMITSAFIFIFGFISGYIYREIKLIRHVTKNLDKIKASFDKLDKQVESDQNPIQARMILDLKHEIVKNIHYFFTADSDTFVCQGQSLEDAAAMYERVKKYGAVARFTNSQDGKMYIFLDGKVEVIEGDIR